LTPPPARSYPHSLWCYVEGYDTLSCRRLVDHFAFLLFEGIDAIKEKISNLLRAHWDEWPFLWLWHPQVDIDLEVVEDRVQTVRRQLHSIPQNTRQHYRTTPLDCDINSLRTRKMMYTEDMNDLDKLFSLDLDLTLPRE